MTRQISKTASLLLNASLIALIAAGPALAQDKVVPVEPKPSANENAPATPLAGTPAPTTPPATAPGAPATIPNVTSTGRPDSFADLAAALLPSVVNISTTQTLKPGQTLDDQGETQNDENGPGGNEDNGGDDNGGDNATPSQPLAPGMPQFPPGSPFEQFFKDFFNRQGQLAPGSQGGSGGNAAPDYAPRKAMSLGSGFIIDGGANGGSGAKDAKDGKSGPLVVTNNHVIENADEIKVILSDNTKLDAELVGRDVKTDLAVLRVKTDRKLTPVRWGDSDAARVGDWVLAIGNPFGLGGTVTAGIVSARARDINAGPYDDFIQTDASINRGNSGGPMFNTKGEVIGINTAIYSPSGGSVGIGFAIPSSMAHTIIDQLRNSGSIKRGWIGVRIQNVTDDIASSLGLPKTEGALVSSVDANGPSAKAGVQPGDVIIAFNGHPVEEMRRLPRLVAETPTGQSVPMTVWRGGKEVTLQAKLGELPADAKEAPAKVTDAAKPGPAVKIDQLGIKLATITPALKKQYSLGDKANGALVTEVEPNSDASDKGLRAGDLITSVGQTAVATPDAVIAKLKDVGRGRPVLLMVERAGDARFVAVMTKK